MRKISYAGESFLTGDAVADALMHFVAALGDRQSAQAVAVPALDGAGGTVVVHLVVGPASELISVPEETGRAEPEDGDFISSIQARTRALSTPRAVVSDEAASSRVSDWDELGSS